jgi:hypothetical protein
VAAVARGIYLSNYLNMLWLNTVYNLITLMFQSVFAADWTVGADFFRDEFTLNNIIATYNKPQV